MRVLILCIWKRIRIRPENKITDGVTWQAPSWAIHERARAHTHTPCARNSSLNSASSPEWNSEPYSFCACYVTCVNLLLCQSDLGYSLPAPHSAVIHHLTICRLSVPLCFVRVRIVCGSFLCTVHTCTRTRAHTRVMLYIPTIIIISVSVFTWITWASSRSCSWGKSSSKSGPNAVFSPQMFLYLLPRCCDEFHWFSTTLLEKM